MKKVNKRLKDEKIISKTRKNEKITKTNTSGDAFVALLRSELGVECLREFRFHPQRRWRFDYAIPECLIAIEVEGGIWVRGRHVSPKGFIADMEKYNTATLMGWSVLRVTPQELETTKTLDMLKTAIYGANWVKNGQKRL